MTQLTASTPGDQRPAVTRESGVCGLLTWSATNYPSPLVQLGNVLPYFLPNLCAAFDIVAR